MKRRDMLTKVPAVAAGLAVGGAVLDAGASEGVGGPEGVIRTVAALGGFRLLEQRETSISAPSGMWAVCEYVVECPYPVGSKAWFAVGDVDEEGAMLVHNARDSKYSYSYTETARRVLFPRFTAQDLGDLDERVVAVYRAACENGFHTAQGPDHEWRVVHVEYRCRDGVEHTIVGMPTTWDPRLALGVMVRGQIG